MKILLLAVVLALAGCDIHPGLDAATIMCAQHDGVSYYELDNYGQDIVEVTCYDGTQLHGKISDFVKENTPLSYSDNTHLWYRCNKGLIPFGGTSFVT